MTHVSRKKFSNKTYKILDDLYNHLLNNLNNNQIKMINSVLLTDTEKEMIVKRLMIIYLLNDGQPVDTVAKVTNTTRQTVDRYRLQLLQMPKENVDFVANKINKWKFKNQLISAVIGVLDVKVKERTLNSIKGYKGPVGK